MSYAGMFVAFLLGGAVVAFFASRATRFSDLIIILGIGVITSFAMMPIFWSDQGGFVLLVATVPFFFVTSLGAVLGCVLNRRLMGKSK